MNCHVVFTIAMGVHTVQYMHCSFFIEIMFPTPLIAEQWIQTYNTLDINLKSHSEQFWHCCPSCESTWVVCGPWLWLNCLVEIYYVYSTRKCYSVG